MKTLRVVTIVAVMAFALCSPTTAAITEPVITATVADTGAMTLLIEGFNLPNGAVYMGKVGGGVDKLNVTNASSTVIEAELKTADPGTYIVAIAVSADQFWTGYVTVGAVGPEGPQGIQGEQGPPGLSGYRTITSTDAFSVSAGGTTSINRNCAAGEVMLYQTVTGGTGAPAGAIVVLRSYPASTTSWVTWFTNTDTARRNATLHRTCAAVAP